jgi:hypothetical protein
MITNLNHAFLRAMLFTTLGAATAAQAAVTYTDLYRLGSPNGLYPFPGGTSNVATNGQITGFGSDWPTGGNDHVHAMMWSPQTPNGIDLHPSEFSKSVAYGTNGSQQVGIVSGTQTGGLNHATLWSGSAASAVNLHPVGFDDTAAYATNGTEQVGAGRLAFGSANSEHALLWRGSAESVVDLHPSFVTRSYARGTDGVQQVGFGEGHGAQELLPLLWTGSAQSCIDLTPPNMTVAQAFASGVGGGQQVGYLATVTDQYRAALWSGSAQSYVSLNPDGFRLSWAGATDGTHQVGFGIPDGEVYGHAMVWNGSAPSFVDLHSVLPATFQSSSAFSVVGDTVYGLGWEYDGDYHAIAWHIPEPTSLAILTGAALLARRGRWNVR